jgi:DNA replication protein DnaC
MPIPGKYSRTGTGKTMLSTALGVLACQKGIPVKFYRTAELINQLTEAKNAGILGTFTKKLNKASIIILDEWGYVPYDFIHNLTNCPCIYSFNISIPLES